MERELKLKGVPVDAANGRDAARRVANVAGAIFQALAGAFFVANLSAEPVADGRGATPIDPAGYAFAIWAPILLLCLVYAAYQALPANRRSPVLRRVGWPLAGAFFANGLWEVASPLGRLGAAQALVAVILAFLAVAYLRLVRGEAGRRRVPSGADLWLVAPTVGVYFGWITAANAVSLTSLAARSGLVGGEALGGALLGSALLVLGSVLALAVVLAGRGGPWQGYVAYAGAFLWALFAIVADQYGASALTTAVALLSAALVTLATFCALRGDRRGEDARAKTAGV